MIRNGIDTDGIEPYLHARTWLTDAARLLRTDPETLAGELIATMVGSGAIVVRNGRVHAAAEHSFVAPGSARTPFPRFWPQPPAIPKVRSRASGNESLDQKHHPEKAGHSVR